MASCQLEARGLRIAFGGRVVLDDIDLSLQQGEVVLLRGENGSGKTTLLNILTGNLEPDCGEIHYLADVTPRAFHFPRAWWRDLNPLDHFVPEFVAREGMVRTWQEVRLFGSQSLRDNIAVASPNQPGENPLTALLAPGLSSRYETSICQQADRLLERLGLGGREESSADKISLGQSKRVAIARAVAAGARILFLDEPLAGLDFRGVADVVALLETLVREHQLTIVVVEHVFNQPHLSHLVTTDWLLGEGQLQVSRAKPSPPAEPPGEANIRPPWFCLLTPSSAEPVDEELPRGAMLSRTRHPDRYRPDSVPVLEVRGLVVSRGPRVVIGLDADGQQVGFDLVVQEGEVVVLQAPNGWGKSTLFAALTGLAPISAGEIRLDGKRIERLPAWSRTRLGVCPLASGEHGFARLRVCDILKLAGRTGGKQTDAVSRRVYSSLSGGEAQGVALASLPEGRLGILDEPFSALDGKRILSPEVSGLTQRTSACLVLAPSAAHVPDHHNGWNLS